MDLASSLHGVLRSKVAVDHTDLAFTRFLLRYLHLGVYSIVQRVGGPAALPPAVCSMQWCYVC